MSLQRAAAEVADIFRAHGPAWRRAQAGHLSLSQLEMMSAIERCRTAALGGHVARCEECEHTRIAYNSCRNRHRPKCQGAAAKQWRSLLRLVPEYAGPGGSRLPLSPHYAPIDERFVLPDLAVPNQSIHLGQPQYPHGARGTSARTWPAVSSLEASRTPAARPVAPSIRRQASENP